MISADTDIDIDFADRDAALAGLPHIAASMIARGRRQRHPTGIYFQEVPVDPVDGLCAVEYEKAASLGYFKLDFLNNSVYAGVRDESHLVELLARDPQWELLDDPKIVSGLAHIGNHFNIVQSIRPLSIEDLAVCIALIRPGKRHLIGRARYEIDQHIWDRVEDGYSFKRAHAIAYAASIVVQLNLLTEQATHAPR